MLGTTLISPQPSSIYQKSDPRVEFFKFSPLPFLLSSKSRCPEAGRRLQLFKAHIIDNRICYYSWMLRIVKLIKRDVPSSRHPEGQFEPIGVPGRTSPHRGLNAQELLEHVRLTRHLRTPCGLSNPYASRMP
ncbi:hypothetical protein LXL04_000064 [Taraxacum kok-saghyz]